jgi:hypothetical protein
VRTIEKRELCSRLPLCGIRGRWEYFEYDWVAKPVDYVRESPGAIHTLHVFENAEIVFTVGGSVEFLNEYDTLNNTLGLRPISCPIATARQCSC